MKAWLAMAVAALLAGCGGRIAQDAAQDAAAPPPVPTVPTGDDAGQIAPACSTWRARGAPEMVSTDPPVPGDVGLEDAVLSAGGALVAWVSAGDLMKPQSGFARRVELDLSAMGDAHAVLQAPSVASPLQGVKLAVGFDHAAIAAWEGTGCVLLPITVDGASNGTLAAVDHRRCVELGATPGGFDVLLQADGNAAAIDLPTTPAGAATGPGVALFTAGAGESVGWVGRAALGDGSFVAAAVISNATEGRLVARHFDASGAPLGDETTIDARPELRSSSVAALSAAAGRAALAWSIPTSGAVRIMVAPLDAGARPAGPAWTAATSMSTTAIALSLAPAGDLLLAWTEYMLGPPVVSSGSVRHFDASGVPTGDRIDLGARMKGARFGPAIGIVAENARAAVVFEASTATTPHRVWAAPLGCAR